VVTPGAQVRIVDWSHGAAGLAAVRHAVFVVEQGVPHDLEWDGLDPDCVHALALDPLGQPIGSGRLAPGGRIGRMAVLAAWRGRGVGMRLLDALIGEARRRGLASVHLHAQVHAMPFYARSGFVAHGPEFDEAGIPHREMQLSLGDARSEAGP
jgi:predicted GNAT family N-acyltransferase